MKVTIGVTDTLKPSMQFYLDWLHRGSIGVECLTLSHVKGNLDELKMCDGIVMTGGGDVHPKLYRRDDALDLVHDVNEDRDRFEMEVARKVLTDGVPLLGICRGMQLFNVSLGGTLIPDLQRSGFRDHRRDQDTKLERRHEVTLDPASRLSMLTPEGRGGVNSSHHQAVEKPGEGLRITGRSEDGVVEAAEWMASAGKPFMQLVQWHPEKMEDFDNPLSHGVLEEFLRGVGSAAHKDSNTLNTIT
jgi:putative glutamine amidotransferase